MEKQPKAIVIGGGLAGLTTATYLGRAGFAVTLYEKASTIGGRADTHDLNGFYFNLGPHAFYNFGTSVKVLEDFGITLRGNKATPKALGVYKGKLGILPANATTLVSTKLLGAKAKLELVKFFGWLAKAKPEDLGDLTGKEWLEQSFRQPELRELVAALMRVTTYANALDRQSAAFFVQLFKATLKHGVIYLDKGWQTLVHDFEQVARKAGVQTVTAARVEAVEADGVVRMADGSTVKAEAVIVAASPHVAATLINHTVVQQWAEEAIPVRAACLDIGLSHLPVPGHIFALGIDQPLYLSVHSAYAKLAPQGGALIHLAKYLDPGVETDPHQDERELEGLLDLVQPGWRELVLERRFLPKMMVSNALVTAQQGGVLGRPVPPVPGMPGVYVVGDWIGKEGNLAGASFASAKHAADLIIEQYKVTPAKRELVSEHSQ